MHSQRNALFLVLLSALLLATCIPNVSSQSCGAMGNGTSCTAGFCCSSLGFCGQTDLHCGTGCDPKYGVCGTVTTTAGGSQVVIPTGVTSQSSITGATTTGTATGTTSGTATGTTTTSSTGSPTPTKSAASGSRSSMAVLFLVVLMAVTLL